jgi:hypothetical protein
VKRDNQKIEAARVAKREAEVRMRVLACGVGELLKDAYDEDDVRYLAGIAARDLPALAMASAEARETYFKLRGPRRMRMARYRPTVTVTKSKNPTGNARTASKRKTKVRRAKS